MNIFKKIRKLFWWRPFYYKEELNENINHCLLCHANKRVNKKDTYPLCVNKEMDCPCNENECLKLADSFDCKIL